MASADLVNLLLSTFSDFLKYMFPLIGVLGGINWIFTYVNSIVFGSSRRTFRE